MSSFENKKELAFTISIGSEKFGQTENNVVRLTGFRATADIEKSGGMAMSTATIKIYGVNQSAMNQLTKRTWELNAISRKTVQIDAIDGTKKTTVFIGQITNAWGDYQAAPDVFLYIEAQAGFFDQLAPVPASSYPGKTDVATIVQQIAAQMGLAFENNGVTESLVDQYLGSTAVEKLRTVAAAVKIDFYIDDTVLAICPKGMPRNGQMPVISPQTGMKGYPTFDRMGVSFETLFNPAIVFGGKVKIESQIGPACGEWKAVSISHHLSSEMPDGPWFSQVKCAEEFYVPR
jgi:hypothetical protein